MKPPIHGRKSQAVCRAVSQGANEANATQPLCPLPPLWPSAGPAPTAPLPLSPNEGPPPRTLAPWRLGVLAFRTYRSPRPTAVNLKHKARGRRGIERDDFLRVFPPHEPSNCARGGRCSVKRYSLAPHSGDGSSKRPNGSTQRHKRSLIMRYSSLRVNAYRLIAVLVNINNQDKTILISSVVESICRNNILGKIIWIVSGFNFRQKDPVCNSQSLIISLKPNKLVAQRRKDENRSHHSDAQQRQGSPKQPRILHIRSPFERRRQASATVRLRHHRPHLIVMKPTINGRKSQAVCRAVSLGANEANATQPLCPLCPLWPNADPSTVAIPLRAIDSSTNHTHPQCYVSSRKTRSSRGE